MSEPFIAEVRIFAGNFAPRGWAFCEGQLLPISQNTALFSLIGTTYGGDGRTTTGLPDLDGRVPMGPGNGPGLTSRRLGEKTGVETVTLTGDQMLNHRHSMHASPNPGEQAGPVTDGRNNTFARGVGGHQYAANANQVAMADETLPSAGGGQTHNNLQPYLALHFIIALVGSYPSRS
jgi:microcystin-dependent protein